jgi:ATP-binding cassette subfamily B (MDR/TAP) protein 1
MKERSYEVAVFWAVVAFGAVFGQMLSFYGFGNASERMNKRVRDATFSALVRQEVSYFDKRSVGKVTSQLQDDAARLHTFTGEPIRSFLIAVSSLFTGLVLSFVVCSPAFHRLHFCFASKEKLTSRFL